MKKLIFVSLLLISSFIFASGNFTTNNTYCVKPNGFNDELVSDDGGRLIAYAQCYHRGQALGPRVIFFEYLDPATYYAVQYMESQYLYFKDNNTIYINDDLTKAAGIGIEFWQYSGDLTFK